mmetsp:Transcript_36945/g.27316  ORF Transcript_36945/g.27316 Transcript_36945/m.27316 type:complete len:87 (+) Transcript_36945:480-740(+)
MILNDLNEEKRWMVWGKEYEDVEECAVEEMKVESEKHDSDGNKEESEPISNDFNCEENNNFMKTEQNEVLKVYQEDEESNRMEFEL